MRGRKMVAILRFCWWIPGAAFLFLFASAEELPFQVRDRYIQANFDELSTWKSIGLYDCGTVALTSGSTFVTLNIDYVNTDTFFALVVPSFTTAVDSLDTLNYYHVVKTGSNRLAVYAINPITGRHDYGDNSTVMYLTFLKDR